MSVRPINPLTERGAGAVSRAATEKPSPAPFTEVLAALAAQRASSTTMPLASAARLESLRWALAAKAAGAAAGSPAEILAWALLALAPAGGPAGAGRPDPGSESGPVPQGNPAKGRDIEEVIGRAAETHGLAPSLLRAVIRAESDFRADAVSPAGAMGLMQLMPATARDLGVTDPFDPEQNVMAGARFLRQLLDRFGDIDSALAAYNWGPGNFRRAPEALPRETRQYVDRVKRFHEAGTG